MFRFVWQVLAAGDGAARGQVVFVEDDTSLEGAVDVVCDDASLRTLVRYHLLDLSATRRPPRTFARIDGLMQTFANRYPAWRVIRASVVPTSRPPLDEARIAALRARLHRDGDDDHPRLFALVTLEDATDRARRHEAAQELAALSPNADYRRALQALDALHTTFVEFLGPVDPVTEVAPTPPGLRRDGAVLRGALRAVVEYDEIARELSPTGEAAAAACRRVAVIRSRVEAARQLFGQDHAAIDRAIEAYSAYVTAPR